MVQRTNSPLKVFSLVLAVAFGIVALAVIYVAFKNSTENRSKASVGSTQDYMRWDFTKGTNGWTVSQGQVASVKGGLLSVQVGLQSSLDSPSFQTTLPQGNKFVAIRMSAGSLHPRAYRVMNTNCVVNPNGVSACGMGPDDAIVRNADPSFSVSAPGVQGVSTDVSIQPGVIKGGPLPPAPLPPTKVTYPCTPKPVCKTGQMCPDIMIYPKGGWCTPTPTPQPKRYVSLAIRYSVGQILQRTIMIGGKASAQPAFAPVKQNVVNVRVPIDGIMNDYSVQLPDIGATTISHISVAVTSGAAKGDVLLFDNIRLVGPVAGPIVMPSCVQPPTCNVSLVAGTDGNFRCPTMDVKSGVTYCPYPVPSKICTPLPPCASEGLIGPDGTRSYCAMKLDASIMYCNNPVPTTQPVSLTCGGIAGKTCPSGYSCLMSVSVGSANTSVSNKVGGGPSPDQTGTCVPNNPPSTLTCGGIAGNTCPTGYTCSLDKTVMIGKVGGGAVDQSGTCVPNNPQGYTCPTSGYVDCMPGPNAGSTMCSTTFITWAKANCPNFGVAY